MEKFEIKLEQSELGKRVRAVLGVPEEFLEDEVISSPVFKSKAEIFINKSIKEYKDLIDENDKNFLMVSCVYYIGYLLCLGMDARLPKQMDNLSTKTILQNISWDKKAIDLLDKANEIIDDVLEEYSDEDNYFSTMIELSPEQSYPEDSV